MQNSNTKIDALPHNHCVQSRSANELRAQIHPANVCTVSACPKKLLLPVQMLSDACPKPALLSHDCAVFKHRDTNSTSSGHPQGRTTASQTPFSKESKESKECGSYIRDTARRCVRSDATEELNLFLEIEGAADCVLQCKRLAMSGNDGNVVAETLKARRLLLSGPLGGPSVPIDLSGFGHPPTHQSAPPTLPPRTPMG